MVSISELETKVVTSKFIQVIGRLRQLGQEFDNYLTNLLRSLDGNPVYYNIRGGSIAVFSRINGIDYQSAENRLVSAKILNPETGKYE